MTNSSKGAGKMEQHAQDRNDLSSERKKGTGSFSIPVEAVSILLEQKATAWQIGAYLALARFSDAENKHSTASLKAIYAATGAANNKNGTADRIMSQLLIMQSEKTEIYRLPSLLYRPDQWLENSEEEIPVIPHALHKVQFVLNDFDCDERVWFPNTLVDGVGKFTQPLKTLKQLGDIAARLLLLMYANNNMVEFGGLPPFGNVYQSYKRSYQNTTCDFAFWTAESSNKMLFRQYWEQILGLTNLSTDENDKSDELKPLWNALDSLLNRGFIEEIITVMDRHPDDQDSRPIYILSTRSKHGKADTTFDALAKNDYLMEKATGISSSDSMGRFSNSFPVIVRTGIEPHIAGIYRLRFRINNQRNIGVTQSWQRTGSEANKHALDMEFLEQQLGC